MKLVNPYMLWCIYYLVLHSSAQTTVQLHSRNIHFIKCSEKPSWLLKLLKFWLPGLWPGHGCGSLHRSPKSPSWWGGTRCLSSRTPPRLSYSCLDFRPFGPRWPLPQKFLDPPLQELTAHACTELADHAFITRNLFQFKAIGNSRESGTPKIPIGNSRELLSSWWEFLGVYKISNFYRVIRTGCAKKWHPFGIRVFYPC